MKKFWRELANLQAMPSGGNLLGVWLGLSCLFLLVWVGFIVLDRFSEAGTLSPSFTFRNFIFAVGAASGFVILWVSIIRGNISEKQANLQTTQQRVDFLDRATNQLGSDNLVIRTGGIRLLKRIAQDFKTDKEMQNDVIERLYAFIRKDSSQSPRDPTDSDYDARIKREKEKARPHPNKDSVSLAIKVLLEVLQVQTPPRTIKLSDLHLSGIDLGSVNLQGADFAGTYLVKANFDGANLSHVDFSFAHLDEANLRETRLSETDFTITVLEGARLDGAKIIDTCWWGAHLAVTWLVGVRFYSNPKQDLLKDVNFEGCLMDGAVSYDSKEDLEADVRESSNKRGTEITVEWFAERKARKMKQIPTIARNAHNLRP